MMLAQGLGIFPFASLAISFCLTVAFVIAVYFFVRWLGREENVSVRWCFSLFFGAWIFWQAFFPLLVFLEAVESVAKTGVPSSRLVELVGPPHSISKDSQTNAIWYYETGVLANCTLGVHVDRNTGLISDMYVE